MLHSMILNRQLVAHRQIEIEFSPAYLQQELRESDLSRLCMQGEARSTSGHFRAQMRSSMFDLEVDIVFVNQHFTAIGKSASKSGSPGSVGSSPTGGTIA